MSAIALAIAALTMTVSAEDPPVLTLEAPGLAFAALPPELAQPIMGELTEESGLVESGPTDNGVTYRISYSPLEVDQHFRKADWLTQQLQARIITDADEHLRVSDEIHWTEGSRDSGHWERSSVGLVPWVNFNVIYTESGAVRACGMAAAVFKEGYVTMLTVIAPMEHAQYARESLARLLGYIYMID